MYFLLNLCFIITAIDQWQRTGWETNKNYIMVDGFVDGWRYEVMVVASNGGIYETSSDSVKIFPTATSRMYLFYYYILYELRLRRG